MSLLNTDTCLRQGQRNTRVRACAGNPSTQSLKLFWLSVIEITPFFGPTHPSLRRKYPSCRRFYPLHRRLPIWQIVWSSHNQPVLSQFDLGICGLSQSVSPTPCSSIMVAKHGYNHLVSAFSFQLNARITTSQVWAVRNAKPSPALSLPILSEGWSCGLQFWLPAGLILITAKTRSHVRRLTSVFFAILT